MPWNEKRFNQFKGWVSDMSPSSIPDGYFSKFQNINMENPTYLETRKGCNLVCTCTASSDVHGIFFDANLETPRLYTVSDGKLWYRELNDSTFTAVDGNLTDGYDVSFVKFYNNIYMVSEKDPIMRYHGTKITTVAEGLYTPPTGKFIYEWNERLFTGNGRYFYYSDVGSGDGWSSYIVMPSNIITSMVINEYPVIFCEDGIYQLEYDPVFTFAYRAVKRGIRPVSAGAVVVSDTGVAVVTKDGLYTFDDNGVVSKTKELHDNFFQKASGMGMDTVSGFHKNGIYYFSMPYDGHKNNCMFVYDSQFERFGLYTGTFAECVKFTVDEESNHYYGMDNSGNLYRLFISFNDDGSAIEFDVMIPLDMDSSIRYKEFWSIYSAVELTGNDSLLFEYGPGNTRVTSSASLASSNRWGTGKWGTMTWGDEPHVIMDYPVASGYSTGELIIVRAYSNNADTPTKIHSFSVEWRPKTGRLTGNNY